MPSTGHFASLPVRVLFAAALFTASTIASAQTPAGTVKRIEGRATLSTAAGARQAAVGSTVFAGDRIVTESASAVGVTLMDGTLMSVGPDSAVTMQAFQFDNTTRQGSLAVDVVKGVMRMVSGLIAKTDARAVAIHTPTATIGIRGTDFVVDVGEGTVTQ
jgi:hypothetical protein